MAYILFSRAELCSTLKRHLEVHSFLQLFPQLRGHSFNNRDKAVEGCLRRYVALPATPSAQLDIRWPLFSRERITHARL